MTSFLAAAIICMLSCNAAEKKETAPSSNTQVLTVKGNLLNDSIPSDKRILQVVCRNDSTESFTLYAPVAKTTGASPVMYFFDPHADGLGAVRRYLPLADKYGFILVASNNSKNGIEWADVNRIWKNIAESLERIVAVDFRRMYVCGFSGGAKQATYLAMQPFGIRSVIACGAILPDMLQQNNLPFSFTAITGEGDMNRSDIIAANSDLDKMNIDHRLLFFNGIHEWPPLQVMDKAFAALDFDAMRKNKLLADSIFINQFISRYKKETDSLLAAHNLLRAAAACRFAYTVLNGISSEASWFSEKEKAITENPNWKQQMAEAAKEQQQEQQLKAVYQQQFQQGDQNYWTNTIKSIMLKAKTPGPEAAMFQRLKAYLSLAFYSISNQCMSSNQNAAAQHFTGLYKQVDETNSEAWYFSAILNARSGNLVQANTDILKAVELGFNDKARLQQQAEFNQTSFRRYRDDALAKIK